MRRAARVDDNQKTLTEQLRSAGFSVALTHTVGKGFPDMVVGFAGHNVLVEIKDPDKPPSKRRLTEDELKWHENWKGLVIVAETIDDVIDSFANLVR